jgi:hypothetical protein
MNILRVTITGPPTRRGVRNSRQGAAAAWHLGQCDFNGT